MVPGIDLAGVVEASAHAGFRAGDRVVLNGYGIGESSLRRPLRAGAREGGLARAARAGGLRPRGRQWQSARRATRRRSPSSRSSATGFGPAPGTCSSPARPAAWGAWRSRSSRGRHRVVASTGRPQEAEYLKALGAAEISTAPRSRRRGSRCRRSGSPASIDSVGSHTLANSCAQVRQGGRGGGVRPRWRHGLPLSVAPFILRGVTLCGIDSVRRRWRPQDDGVGPARADLAPPAGVDDPEIALGDSIDCRRGAARRAGPRKVGGGRPPLTRGLPMEEYRTAATICRRDPRTLLLQWVAADLSQCVTPPVFPTIRRDVSRRAGTCTAKPRGRR